MHSDSDTMTLNDAFDLPQDLGVVDCGGDLELHAVHDLHHRLAQDLAWLRVNSQSHVFVDAGPT